MFQCLLLFSSLSSIVQLAPAPASTQQAVDFKTTYMQFFKIKDIIDKINIKRFEEFYGPVIQRTTGPSLTTSEEPEDDLPEIDLTQETILNNDGIYKGPAPAEGETIATPEPQITTTTIESATTLPPQPEEEVTTVSTESVDMRTEGEIETQPSDVTNEGVEATQSTDGENQNNEIYTSFLSDDSVAAANKYGYKILLKKVGGKEVPVGKIKYTIPTILEIQDEETVTESNVDDQSNISPEFQDIMEETTEVEEEPAVTVSVTTEPVEATTELNISDLLPSTITAVIPSLDNIDAVDMAVAQGVRQMAENTERAVEEIKTQTAGEVIVFGDCSALLTEVENMLADLARNVASQSDNLAEILTLGNSIKDQTETESLARTGAEILRRVDPFLSSLVPPKVQSCAGSSSSSMLVSLSGLASQLDSLASVEEDQERALSLHNTATSLQLAAWVISTLQHSVQTFYTQDGVCGDERSSTAEILGSLSEAITGYIPIVSMLGNEGSLEDLERTVLALRGAQADIVTLESQTGARLPGVSCDASFREMAAALDTLADFVHVVQNQV